MKKKHQSNIALNILNLIRLEDSLKKQKDIKLPISKLKPSISSYTLFLNQKKKYKNTILNKESKNINNKNKISYNKPKHINFTKSTELIQNNNQNKEKRNISKKNNNNKINNINFNNNINIINHLEKNAIDYFVNSSKSVHKKRYSHSVHEQRKKVINDVYSKKHIKEKEKEINCLKLSSNNTNSTSINTNNTNNFNSKNSKIKNTLSANIEEIKKENQKLKSQIEIMGKENKNLNKKINKLRDKNLELKKILYSIKKEKDDYSKSISQSLKLLKLLKNNGLELSEIMENLSNSNSENEEENEQEENIEKAYNNNDNEDNEDKYEIMSANKKTHLDYFSENDKNEKNNDSAYTDISFGRLECHEEFSLKKIPKGLKNIPKLKIYNINKENMQ